MVENVRALSGVYIDKRAERNSVGIDAIGPLRLAAQSHR